MVAILHSRYIGRLIQINILHIFLNLNILARVPDSADHLVDLDAVSDDNDGYDDDVVSF